MKKLSASLIKEWTKRSETWMTVESATGGAIASQLTSVPGASQAFAGSLVVYQPQMKKFWLDIDVAQFEGDAVGLEITEALAESALTQSPQMTGVLAITGHLGPDAPKALDGKIFIAVSERRTVKSKVTISTQVIEIKLQAKTREKRRIEAVEIALQILLDALE